MTTYAIVNPVLFGYPVCGACIITTRRIAVRMRNACINQGDIRTSACFTCCTNRDALHPRRKEGYAAALATGTGARLFTVAEVRKTVIPPGRHNPTGVDRCRILMEKHVRGSVRVHSVLFRHCSPSAAKMTDDDDQRTFSANCDNDSYRFFFFSLTLREREEPSILFFI